MIKAKPDLKNKEFCIYFSENHEQYNLSIKGHATNYYMLYKYFNNETLFLERTPHGSYSDCDNWYWNEHTLNFIKNGK